MRYLALPMQRNFRKPIANGLDRNDAYTVTSLDDLAKIYAKPLYAPRCQALIICLEKACRVLDEYLTRFLQLGQTSLRLIRVRRVWIFFYDLPIKFRSVGLVVLLLFELRGIV